MTGVDGVTGAKVDDAAQHQSASDPNGVEASKPEPTAEAEAEAEVEPKARKGRWMSWWRGGAK